ncbi:LIM and calponin-likey domains-containing protein 1, partial [Varanus komodoensis]
SPPPFAAQLLGGGSWREPDGGLRLLVCRPLERSVSRSPASLLQQGRSSLLQMASPALDLVEDPTQPQQEPAQESLQPDPALAEAQQWIEQVTGRSFGDTDFRSALENGVLLCELLNSIKPGLIKKINRLPTPIAGLDNIALFLRGCKELGLKESQLFDPGDLQDTSSRATNLDCTRKLKNVLITIYWLGKTANSSTCYSGATLNLKEFEGLLTQMRKDPEDVESPRRSIRDSGYVDCWDSERSDSLSPPRHGRDDSFDSLDSFGSRSQQTPSPDVVLRGSSDGRGSDSESDLPHRKLPDVKKDDMSARRISYGEPKSIVPFNQYLPNKSNQTAYIPAPLRKKKAEREEYRKSWSTATSPLGGERPFRSVSMFDMRCADEAAVMQPHSKARHEKLQTIHNQLKEDEDRWQDDLARERRERELHEAYKNARSREEADSILQQYIERFTISEAVLERLEMPKLLERSHSAEPNSSSPPKDPNPLRYLRQQSLPAPKYTAKVEATIAPTSGPEASVSTGRTSPSKPFVSKAVPMLTPKPYSQPRNTQQVFRTFKVDGKVSMNGETANGVEEERTRECTALIFVPSPSRSPKSDSVVDVDGTLADGKQGSTSTEIVLKRLIEHSGSLTEEAEPANQQDKADSERPSPASDHKELSTAIPCANSTVASMEFSSFSNHSKEIGSDDELKKSETRQQMGEEAPIIQKERYQKEQDKLKEEWERAQKEVEEEERKYYEEERKIIEDTVVPFTVTSNSAEPLSTSSSLTDGNGTVNTLDMSNSEEENKQKDVRVLKKLFCEPDGTSLSKNKVHEPWEENRSTVNIEGYLETSNQRRNEQDEQITMSECMLPNKMTLPLYQDIPQNQQPLTNPRVSDVKWKNSPFEHNLGLPVSSTRESRRSISGKKLCSSCGQPLGKGAAMIIETLGLYFHIQCFRNLSVFHLPAHTHAHSWEI